MSDEKVKILNGEVGPEDRVVYASIHGDLRMGTILEITSRDGYWGPEPQLKIRVEEGSISFGGYPYIKTVGCTDRMMKL